MVTLTCNVSNKTTNAQFERWVPWVPNPDQVQLYYWQNDSTSYMDVYISTPTSGYNFSDWGTPIGVGNNITVNAEIWRWTAATLPVEVNSTYTYNLGNLPAGEYVFTFTVWSLPVKDITFIVLSGPPIDPSGGGAGSRMPLLS